MGRIVMPWNLHFERIKSTFEKKILTAQTVHLKNKKSRSFSWYKTHPFHPQDVLIFQGGLHSKHQQSFGWAKSPYFSLLSMFPCHRRQSRGTHTRRHQLLLGAQRAGYFDIKKVCRTWRVRIQITSPARGVNGEAVTLCVCFTHCDEPHS